MIWFWAYDFAAWVVLPAFALFVLHKFASTPFQDYGLGAPLGWKDVVYTIPLPLVACALASFFATSIGYLLFGRSDPAFSYTSVLQPLGSLWMVGTIYLAVTAGLWESVFYIGVPWLYISRAFGPSAAPRLGFAMLSTLLFAVDHHESGAAHMVGVSAFQLVALYWYLKLGTLWPVIGAHTLVDAYHFWPSS
jgi:hypothetical protein